ncbi:hypothetical protein C8Q73DRAFT_712819 [Cubamyces lactineus]|nr:hypothetical protein C8Q73DRAFT_712819 [Cubamyces lactineus]
MADYSYIFYLEGGGRVYCIAILVKPCLDWSIGNAADVHFFLQCASSASLLDLLRLSRRTALHSGCLPKLSDDPNISIYHVSMFGMVIASSQRWADLQNAVRRYFRRRMGVDNGPSQAVIETPPPAPALGPTKFTAPGILEIPVTGKVASTSSSQHNTSVFETTEQQPARSVQSSAAPYTIRRVIQGRGCPIRL